MNSRIYLLLIVAVFVTACRGNLPRPDRNNEAADADARRSRTAEIEKPVVNNKEQVIEQPSAGTGAYLPGDGPGADVPANVARTPDAIPRAEPLHRYANRKYKVLGKDYTPLTATGNYKERGVASWYGKKFHGQRTSIGEVYDMYSMSAAHTTLPIPSYARVTNLKNQLSIIVRINDRGPFMHDRIIDLSYTAAVKLGIIGSGQGMVEVESLVASDTTSTPLASAYKEPLHITALPAETPASSGNAYLQLGAFNSQNGAEEFLSSMRAKLNDTGKQLSLSHKNGMVRVRIGPYANADAARARALDLQTRLGFKPVLSLN